MDADPKEVEIWIAYYHPRYFPAYTLPAMLEELEDGSRYLGYWEESQRPGRIAALKHIISHQPQTTP